MVLLWHNTTLAHSRAQPATPSPKKHHSHVSSVENPGTLSWSNFELNDRKVADVVEGQSFPRDVPETPPTRENATFFSLVRNKDFPEMLSAIKSVEHKFNSVYHYDWVFANDEPFNDLFILQVQEMVSGTAHFVEIPPQFWQYPDFIDLDKAKRTRDFMRRRKVKYGDLESYRHMCRFNSGFFFKLPIMTKYKYYWRVEPGISFNCDIHQTDWFKYMRENGKKYAFVLAPLELHTTVKNFWRTTKQFIHKYPQLINPNNTLLFLTDDNMDNYNMCHFWSNFEIGDMDFYRLEAYQQYFDFVDHAGGFYYSRWGDAPVHSVAVSALLLKDEVFHLTNSGYFHDPNYDCPRDAEIRHKNHCACRGREDHTWSAASCIPKWYEVTGMQKPPHSQFKFKNKHKFEVNQDVDRYLDW